jgi:DNA-binding NtrC family response regulator
MADKRRLLLIDDDKVFCEMAREYLGNDDLDVVVANTLASGLEACANADTDVVILDQKLPDGEGRLICSSILKYNDRTKIIFSTAYPSFDNAVYAVKSGAYDYLSKPVEPDELRLAVERALRTLELEHVVYVHRFKRDRESRETVLIGENGGLAGTKRLIELAARSNAPVLITGATGVGKNIVAKSVHFKSPSSGSEFLSVNCAALPENLIEAELFGYEKGAFTGATASRKGIFEMAEGGTLLLDEIGEMPYHLQPKLLSVLEEGRVKRIGGETVKKVDVRIIAATNKDLQQAIKDKTFREDLFYRLSVINISVPLLKDRKKDIPDLCELFLRKATNRSDASLSKSELDRMMQYHWPGNVRELKNIIERAVLLADGQSPRPSELLAHPAVENKPADTRGPAGPGRIPTMDEIEKEHIMRVLDICKGNKTRTAEILGISLATLKRKIKTYTTGP